MKLKLYILFIIIYPFCSYAQEKVALNKRQTVDYLHNKISESNGYTSLVIGKKHYHKNASIDSWGLELRVNYQVSNYNDNGKMVTVTDHKNHKVPMYIYPCDYFLERNTAEFNPADILSIELVNNSQEMSDVGYIKITLRVKKVKYVFTKLKTSYVITGNTYIGECAKLDGEVNTSFFTTVNIPYLQIDDTNFKKIKRAFEHLRDLSKEDDPFGN